MISRYPFCRAQGPTSCPGVVILAVAFPGRHLDQRRPRKPAVGVSGRLQEDTGTVIASALSMAPSSRFMTPTPAKGRFWFIAGRMPCFR